jgi:hypothetical protein
MKVTKAGREKKGRKRPLFRVFLFSESKNAFLFPLFHFHFFFAAKRMSYKQDEQDEQGEQDEQDDQDERGTQGEQVTKLQKVAYDAATSCRTSAPSLHSSTPRVSRARTSPTRTSASFAPHRAPSRALRRVRSGSPVQPQRLSRSPHNGRVCSARALFVRCTASYSLLYFTIIPASGWYSPTDHRVVVSSSRTAYITRSNRRMCCAIPRFV